VTPPVSPVVPRPRPGYEALVDSIHTVDASGLRGKRIALDPGHGGFFAGAVGVQGLTEAEVNLGVSLQLRDLLERQGARVFLTRDAQRDFLTPADSSLRSDLAERSRLANLFAPDLFISIHHNADAAGKHDINETQTYYKLGDEGPSLDVAQDVHRALVRNVGIEKNKVVPGNYFVLRNSAAPALLTETSYITNPDVEKRLRLPEKQSIEAAALYVGIARYFARNIPKIEQFTAIGTDGRADTLFHEIAAPTLVANITGAFDEARLTLDGLSVPLVRRAQRLEWKPEPLEQGRHEAALQVRLTGVGAAREQRIQFTVQRQPARMEVALASLPTGKAGEIVPVRIAVKDAYDKHCMDSLTVRLAALKPIQISPSETLVTARDGVAWAYFRTLASPSGSKRTSTPTRLRASLPTGITPVDESPLPNRPKAAPVSSTITFESRPDVPATWRGFAIRMPQGVPLANVSGTKEPHRQIDWLNRDGFAILERDGSSGPILPVLPGFRRWGDDAWPPRYTPIAGGALHGKRITLDPEGGGEDPAGLGALGTRAANLNLETARILAAFLTAAGAHVQLTRAGDYAISEVERVQISEGFRADRYLRIGHRMERIGYYFSSAAGKTWGQRTLRELARLGVSAPKLADDAQYPLQQTSCPALYVSPDRIDRPPSEERMLAPGTLRAEAYALYLALAREWIDNAVWPLDSIEVRDRNGAPIAGVAIAVGGNLLLETDAGGRVRFARTENGPLAVQVLDPRASQSVILLDASRGTVLTGARNP
jgi:N-acetylmuramoyl-L-alanine amidase